MSSNMEKKMKDMLRKGMFHARDRNGKKPAMSTRTSTSTKTQQKAPLATPGLQKTDIKSQIIIYFENSGGSNSSLFTMTLEKTYSREQGGVLKTT
jgi:hypothetical protein